MHLYDLKVGLLQNGCGDQSATLDLLLKRWQGDYSSLELNTTSHLAIHLNDFLFEDRTLGVCVHHCSLNGQKPDFTVLPVGNMLKVEEFVAVSDYSPTGITAARTEIFAYSNYKGSTIQNHMQLRLPFTCTRDVMTIDLHMGLDKKILTIPIISATESEERKVALQLLKTGCKILLEEDIICNSQVSPTKELDFKVSTLMITKHSPLSMDELGRIFKSGDYVYKLYDPTIPCFIELQRQILPEASLINLSTDGTYKMLIYKYRGGQHYPTSVNKI